MQGRYEVDNLKASPFDRIWGVGYGAANAEPNRGNWGGNLLGKALMRVRDRLRAEADWTAKGRVEPEKAKG